jgi:hypothetical protein
MIKIKFILAIFVFTEVVLLLLNLLLKFTYKTHLDFEVYVIMPMITIALFFFGNIILRK